MKTNRRDFIKKAGAATALFSFGGFITNEVLAQEKKLKKLTVLHTNDTHSQLEPFPANHPKYPSMAGIARRATIVNQIRNEEKNVLLLDAGDIFQGTPFFNFYGGELNFKLMSMLKYDAATIGNHDLDNGVAGFKKHLGLAKFPFVVSNYDVGDSLIKNDVEKYLILNKDGIRIGIIGASIELEGLVDPKNFTGIKYQDPIEKSNKYAKELKKKHSCDIVILLSHLGYKYKGDKVSDVVLAENSKNIDLIIGGHTHTFMDAPDVRKNLDNQDVLVTQSGFAGIQLGRIDFYFDLDQKKMFVQTDFIDVDNNLV